MTGSGSLETPPAFSLRRAARPREGAPLADHGHPRPKFLRALETGSLILAELCARECGYLSLDEALRLTALVALHDRDRGERYAHRWLSRYLAEQTAATLDDVTIVVTCLRALGGPAHAAALDALQSALSERLGPLGR